MRDLLRRGRSLVFSSYWPHRPLVLFGMDCILCTVWVLNHSCVGFMVTPSLYY
ncbi:hypothetical protein F383_36085 [Gossypium arboreum]|uniref:Uncharacterized protein n=1 Tax=Gossypium arboreum TaxID=29729 RepID=A0A0B0Q1J3_GOSAR|nr:hypothetical protein F383_36085 [Gossypium arboreum]